MFSDLETKSMSSQHNHRSRQILYDAPSQAALEHEYESSTSSDECENQFNDSLKNIPTLSVSFGRVSHTLDIIDEEPQDQSEQDKRVKILQNGKQCKATKYTIYNNVFTITISMQLTRSTTYL